MMQAAVALLLPLTAACRWTEPLKRFTSLSCVNNGEVSTVQGVCMIRRSNGGHVDKVLWLITCERGLFSNSAEPATAAGIDAG